jgi:hypothetical protein
MDQRYIGIDRDATINFPPQLTAAEITLRSADVLRPGRPVRFTAQRRSRCSTRPARVAGVTALVAPCQRRQAEPERGCAPADGPAPFRTVLTHQEHR